MKRILFIFFLYFFAQTGIYSQSFTIDDLLSLPALSQNNMDRFMNKNGFASHKTRLDDDLLMTSYFEKKIAKKTDSVILRSVDLYKKDDTRYFALRTTSLNEYLEGQKQLIKAGFFYDNKKDTSKPTPILFQKKNITVETICRIEDDITQYTFLLQKKEPPNPASIQHAEDLLKFNSHEFLVSYFGEKNVKKDLYYFSEKELKKCSVLFGNSSRQVVFVWKDETNLYDLSFILISNIMPTASAEKFDKILANNQWAMKNGVHAGMNLMELLKLNGNDFEFYGNQSELSFIIKPGSDGKIDFKKTVITLSCSNCNNNRVFNTSIVSALDIAGENLPISVYNIMLVPSPAK
jgi:hypothetical protein